MGQKVLIIGQSGTGKSTSLRNFDRNEVCLIKSINKQLPFRGKFEETYVSDNVQNIISRMRSTDKKVIVIDDAQYVMGNEFFRRAAEQGWNKFTDIGKNFYDLLTETDNLAEDVIVYFLLHTEKDSDGNIKVKTIGKMLDEKLTVEGTATIVLMTNVVDGKYTFQTQNSGKDICKSPMGMFENFLIDNDLKMVDGIIREYYELSDVKPVEKGVQAEKPTRGRRERTTNNSEQTANEEPKRERRSRKPVEEVPAVGDDGLTDEEREAFKAEMEVKNQAYEERMKELETPKRPLETADATPTPVRKTLAEKLAEGGFGQTEETPEETPVRRTRRRA